MPEQSVSSKTIFIYRWNTDFSPLVLVPWRAAGSPSGDWKKLGDKGTIISLSRLARSDNTSAPSRQQWGNKSASETEPIGWPLSLLTVIRARHTTNTFTASRTEISEQELGSLGWAEWNTRTIPRYCSRRCHRRRHRRCRSCKCIVISDCDRTDLIDAHKRALSSRVTLVGAAPRLVNLLTRDRTSRQIRRAIHDARASFLIRVFIYKGILDTFRFVIMAVIYRLWLAARGHQQYKSSLKQLLTEAVWQSNIRALLVTKGTTIE